MLIIPPQKISAEIIDVIHTAGSYVILVSPYVDVEKWSEFQHAIKLALKRQVTIVAYVRSDPDNYKSWQQLEVLDLQPRLIDKLHAKMYFNESKAVITSMNLLSSSKLSAIEFGVSTSDEKDIMELKSYVKKFLNPIHDFSLDEEDVAIAQSYMTDYLQFMLDESLSGRITVFYKKGTIHVKGKYTANLSFTTDSKLCVSIIVSHDEFNAFDKFRTITDFDPSSVGYEVEPVPGAKRCYNTLDFVSKSTFRASNWQRISVTEKQAIAKAVVAIIESVYNFKSYIYEVKRGKYKI